MQTPANVRLSIWATVVIAFVTLLFGFWVDRAPNVTGDTVALIKGSETALKCIEEEKFVGCNSASPGRTQIAQFPPYQYVPSIVMTVVGMSDQQQLTAFSLINVASLLLLIVMVFVVASRNENRAWGYGLILVLLTGPLLWYAFSTFGEMLAALLTVLFATAILMRWHWMAVAGTLCLAGLTKEVAAPFLVAIGLICLSISPHQRGLAKRPQLVGIAVGTVAAIGLSMLFNVFRYGHVQNDIYTSVRPPPLDQKIQDFVGLLVAPNGGIVPFWPLASLLLLLGLVYGVVALRRRTGNEKWWPGVAVVGILLALFAGLAYWPFPFGWVAWGPRLAVPWVPALVLILAVAYRARLKAVAVWLTSSTTRLVGATLVISALALPQVGVLWKPQVVGGFFSPDRGCPYVATYDMGAKYYRCIDYLAWSKYPILVRAYSGLDRPPAIAMGLGLILANLSLLTLMRLSVRQTLGSRFR